MTGSPPFAPYAITSPSVRQLLEVGSPGPVRYIVGALIMMIGVVLPVGFMMFRTKRVPSSSGYSKQTSVFSFPYWIQIEDKDIWHPEYNFSLPVNLKLKRKHVFECSYGALAAMKSPVMINISASGLELSSFIITLIHKGLDFRTIHKEGICSAREQVVKPWMRGNGHSS
ncbi:hypothetical protein AXG93_4368s2240 [Marchantia polymorpha subsp. ruderalis]|uniref:Uncharacterized protein n=1 Tax=Marchantia polymorpha subsp. ruderalis TaxID=1480154 RepID=A0A176VY84_MARPO|nr:hypothetical protein AXG93_4368s2240 [Marchantia polymorpha subsp. ruderalis]